MSKDLSRLISPRSIAILGGNWADTVMVQCRRFGFSGSLYRVHPKRAISGDSDCYSDIQSLPESPDAVFLGVNRDLTVSLIKDLKSVNAGGAIGFASGFNELHTAEGDEATRCLLEEAGDFPILGPNCYGLINFLDRAPLWPDEAVPKTLDSGVAFIAQSGTIANNVMFSDRAMPLAYLVTLGNQSLIDAADLIHVMLDDKRVTAIGLYLEGINDMLSFRDACLRAALEGIPITLFKGGRSHAARRMTYSHTGSIGGEDRYMDALFSRLGVARVETLNELIECLKLLHFTGGLEGNRIVVCGGSGGEMTMSADIAESIDVKFADISKDAGEKMSAILGDRVQVSNPLDFHTYLWHDPDSLHKVFLALMGSPADIYVLLNDHPKGDIIDIETFKSISRAFIDAAVIMGVKAISGCSVVESQSDYVRDYAALRGVAPMQGLESCFTAIACAAKIYLSRQKILPPSLRGGLIIEDIVSLNEYEAKELISGWGIPIPKSEMVTCDEAVVCCEKIGFPLVVKAVSDTLLHKSEEGGVALNLRSIEEVEEVVRNMSQLAETLLIEEMVEDTVVEMIIGMDYDPQFGAVLVVGAGGIFAELFDDSVILLPPSSRESVEEALSGLKIMRIIEGYRGRAVGDKQALIDVIMILLDRLEESAGEIAELDINPLIVREEGKGVIAVDSLIRKKV